MGKTALLAKPAAPTHATQACGAVQLQDKIARIIQDTYSGTIDSEFWARPARAAAKRIVELLYESGSFVSR